MSIVKFSDVAHRANTKEDRFNTDKIYYVGGEHIDSNELFVRSKGIIKGSTIGPMFYCGFTSGQILFVTRNPHLRKCGIVDFDGICSEKTFVIESKDTTKLSQEYLAIIMQSDEFWNYCEENKSGGVNYFLNWSTLADYEFELPPIQIQEEIAEKVMSAYRLKQSYQKLLTATDEMIKSQFIEMFGQVSEESPCLNDIARVYDGTHKTPTYTDSGIPFISVENITDIYSSQKYISREDYELYKHKPEHGDIFMTRIGSIGKCAVYESFEPLAYYVSLALIKPNKDIVHPKFLKYYIESSDGAFELRKRSLLKAFPMKINLGEIGKIKVIVPAKDKQLEFVKIAEQADKSKFELRKSIEAIDAVIKNLING